MPTATQTQPTWTTRRCKDETQHIVDKTAYAKCGCKIVLHKTHLWEGWLKLIYLYPCKQGQRDFAGHPDTPINMFIPCNQIDLECDFNVRAAWREAKRIGKEQGHPLEV